MPLKDDIGVYNFKINFFLGGVVFTTVFVNFMNLKEARVGTSKVLIFVFITILSEIHLMFSCWSLPLSLFYLFINQPTKHLQKTK